MLATVETLNHASMAREITIERIPAFKAEALRDAWAELASDTVEPNYFYSPAFLLAAFRLLPDQGASSVLAVWQSDGSQRRLIGLLPLMSSKLHWGLPVPLLHSWRSPYCSYSAPLLRKGAELVAARALLDGIARYRWQDPAIYLHRIDPNGAAFEALSTALEERGQAWRQVRTLERTVATPPQDFDAYVSKNMSSRRRYKYRKALRDLAKLGEVTFELATTAEEVKSAVEEFLELEKSSWKGDAGSAMGSNVATAEFMREAYPGGAGEVRSVVHSLCLDGRKIAIVVVAKCGDTLWMPKIASDPTYHKCVPGILLTMNVVENLGQALGVKLVDSASKPGSWVEAYWGERQQLADVIVATTPATPGSVIDGFVNLDKMRRGLGPQIRETFRRGQTLVRTKIGRRAA